MKKILYLLCILCCGFISEKKESKQVQIIEQLEIVTKSFEEKTYDKGVVSLEIILKMDTILPNDVAFFMGAYLDNYQKTEKAEEAFLRYLKVSNKEGTYYKESIDFLNKIWENKKIDSCNLCIDYPALNSVLNCTKCVKENVALQKLIEEECMDNGMSLCSLCKGEGIIIRIGSLGNLVYQTCHKCHGEGYIPCPHLKKNK